jgi:hypothetical protein
MAEEKPKDQPIKRRNNGEIDKRQFNGGHKKGGRKSNSELIELATNMDAVLAPKDLWKAIAKQVKKGDSQAAKLWVNYRYGLPKQILDLQTNAKNVQINALFNFNPLDPDDGVVNSIDIKEIE